MVGSFEVTDENGKKLWLFYTGKDFSKLMPGEIYKDYSFTPYVITSVDYPTFGKGIPANIRVMEHLLNEKLTKWVILKDGPYNIIAIEELLLPLGFKIVFK